MNTYEVVVPVFSDHPEWVRDEDGKKRPYFHVEHWQVMQTLQALNAEIALQMAKAMGHSIPVIDRA